MTTPQFHVFSSTIILPIFIGAIVHQIFLGVTLGLAYWYYVLGFGSTDSILHLVGMLLGLNVFEAGIVTSMLEYPENVEIWTMMMWAQPGVTEMIVFFAQRLLLDLARNPSAKSRALLAFFLPQLLLSLGFGLATSIRMSQVEPQIVGAAVVDATPIRLWCMVVNLTNLSFYAILSLKVASMLYTSQLGGHEYYCHVDYSHACLTLPMVFLPSSPFCPSAR